MIVTVTPNPSLDRTLEVADLVVGGVNRATASRVDAGGKGVNVARALVRNGHVALAVLPIGGAEGDHLAAILAMAGIDTHLVPVTAATRENLTLITTSGTGAGTTKVNASGPPLTSAEVDLLEKAVMTAVEGATWVAASGSLPPGVPDDFYARLAATARSVGARCAVDTSGTAFRATLAGMPDLCKPNTHELAEVLGRPMRTIGDVVGGARQLCDGGVGAVLASLGADGAVLVDAEGQWHASTPAIAAPRSTVGAGDATLAGFLAAGGHGPLALAQAVTYGAAAVSLPGSVMPGPEDLVQVQATVTAPDLDRPLRG